MSYYDVDAILTDAEKVPCQFGLDVPYLGHLDSASSTGLKPGTPLALPLWLAEMLTLAATPDNAARAPLTLSLPPCVAAPVVAALKADPRAVPLRDQSPHLFAVGARMLDLFDDPDLAAVLRRAFVVRAAQVGLHAPKADEGAPALGDDFLRGLDDWERLLFRRGHDGVRAMKEWMDNVNKS